MKVMPEDLERVQALARPVSSHDFSHNSNWRLTPLTLLPGRQYNQNKSVAQVRWTVWAQERNGE